jgi:hypothetical protein
MILFGISDRKYKLIVFQHVNVSFPRRLELSARDREIVFSRSSPAQYVRTYSIYGRAVRYRVGIQHIAIIRLFLV